MPTWKTREVFIPSPGLIPHGIKNPSKADKWLFGDLWDKWRESWGTRRRIYIMPWNSHVVSEGIVDKDDRGLKRALRES